MIKEITAKNDLHHEILAKQLVALIEKRAYFNRAETRLMRDLLFELKVNNDAAKPSLKACQNHIDGMNNMIKNWEKKGTK